MIKLSRILLPTDFSDFSSPATDYACEFAGQFGAELHVLHVLEVYQSATPDFAMGLALPSRITEVQEHAEKELARLLEPEWAANHKVVTAITEGVRCSWRSSSMPRRKRWI